MAKRDSENWMNKLREKGYRITPPLSAVVRIMADSVRVMDAREIFLQARLDLPDIGLMTIYRTLEKLEDARLVQRVHQPKGCQSFAPAPSGHQHLLLCVDCGRIEYFSGDDLDAWFTGIGKDKGYNISDHWLQLFGHCGICRKITKP